MKKTLTWVGAMLTLLAISGEGFAQMIQYRAQPGQPKGTQVFAESAGLERAVMDYYDQKYRRKPLTDPSGNFLNRTPSEIAAHNKAVEKAVDEVFSWSPAQRNAASKYISSQDGDWLGLTPAQLEVAIRDYGNGLDKAVAEAKAADERAKAASTVNTIQFKGTYADLLAAVKLQDAARSKEAAAKEKAAKEAAVNSARQKHGSASLQLSKDLFAKRISVKEAQRRQDDLDKRLAAVISGKSLIF